MPGFWDEPPDDLPPDATTGQGIDESNPDVNTSAPVVPPKSLLDPYAPVFDPSKPGGGSLGGGGNQGDWQGYIRKRQSELPASAASLKLIAQELKDQGYNVNVPTHAGGLSSDDKLTVNGQTVDFITGVDGPNPGWWFGEQGRSNGAGAVTHVTPYDAPNINSTFTPPDPSAVNTDPSYQFRLNQGAQSLTNLATRGGGLLTGGVAKGLIDYGQNAASQEYGNIYNRALANWQANTGQANTAANFGLNAWQANAGQTNAEGQLANQGGYLALAGDQQNFNQGLDTYKTNQGNYYQGQQNQYNGLYGLANLGLNGINSANGSGADYANNAGNIYANQGNSKAAGTVGAANATNSGIAGGANAASQALYLAWLKRQGVPSSTPTV